MTNLTPYLKGLVTKAANNHDKGVAFRTLRTKLQELMPKQQAKHATRKLIADRA